jgi:nicotinamidase-related amidase
MKRMLLIVDVQNGFVNSYTEAIPGRIRTLVERGRFDPVLFTCFVNTPESPYRRILDWHECAEAPDTDIAPELADLVRPGCAYTKPGFTGIPDDLAKRLRDEAPEEVVVVGIDTDMCVLKVAMDVFDLGITPVVLVDCCASTGGLQAHLAGLATLARNIGANQLRTTGLDEGYLGRPPDEAEKPEAVIDRVGTEVLSGDARHSG